MYNMYTHVCTFKTKSVISECNVANDDSSNTSISPGLSLRICSTPLPVNFVTVESTQGI